MSGRIAAHIRGNVIGYVALFVALCGTAYAVDGPLPGQNTVGSADIINGEVATPDMAPSSVTSGKIANGHVRAADLGVDAVTGDKILDGTVGLADLASNSVNSAKIANLSIGNADLAANSVNTPKVVNDSLFGQDIRENTLEPLDGHDAFSSRCDPHSTSYVVCASVQFYLGRSMPMLTIYNWAQWSDDNQDERVAGTCLTRLDGNSTSGTIWVGMERASGPSWRAGATPVVDVLPSVPAGIHTLALVCSQNLRDIVFGDIRIAAVELAMD